MTITGADYRLAGTSEDNHQGPFIRQRDTFVLAQCRIFCLVSCDPQTSQTSLLRAECIDIHSRLIFIKAISEVRGNVGQTWVLSSRDALSVPSVWTAASNASNLDASDISVCPDGFAMVAAKFKAFGYLFPGIVAEHKTHRTEPLFPKM